MSNIQNYKIGVVIDADASKLQSEAKKADKAVEGIGIKGFGEIKKGFSESASAFGLIPESASKASDVFGSVSESLGGVASTAGAAGLAVGAVTIGMTAAVGVGLTFGKTLFDLAQQTSAFGVEIYNFNKLTGFTVETIQALKIAADQSGISLDNIEEVYESFVELMIEGGQAEEDAVKKLKSLGLDPQTAFKDLEGSFLKVLDRIREMPTQAGKAKVAMDGMGESGLNMVKVADAMNGGTANYIKTLKEAGVIMDAEGIQKSKEFDRTLKALSLQAKGIANTFTVEFMPEITGAMEYVDQSFKGNSETIKFWGDEVGNTIGGVVTSVQFLKGVVNGAMEAIGLDFLSTSNKVSLILGQFGLLGNAINLMRTLGDKPIGDLGSDFSAKLSKETEKLFKSNNDLVKAPPKKSESKEKATSAKSSANKNSVEQEMRKTFEELGFTVVRTFGQAINKGSLHPKGLAIDLSIKKKSIEDLFEAAIVGIQKGWQLVDERVPRIGKGGKPIKQTGPHFHFEKDGGKDPSLFLGAEAYGGEAQLAFLKKLDAERLAGRKGLGEFEKQQNAEVQKGIDLLAQYQNRLESMGESSARINLERNKDFQKLGETEKARLRILADEIDATEKANRTTEQFNSFIQNLTSQYETYHPVQKSATEELNLWLTNLKETGVVLADGDEERLKYQAWTIDQKEEQKRFNAELEKELEWLERIETAQVERKRNAEGKGIFGLSKPEALAPEGVIPESPFGERSPDGLGGGFFGSFGISRLEEDAARITSVYQMMGEQVGNVIGGMVQAGEQLLAQYIMTGEGSAEAFSQLAASVISGIAVQAGVKAIFELAEGIAAASNPFTAWMAPGHFLAAKTYGIISGAAVGVGLGIGAAGGLQGKGSKATQSDNQRIDFIENSQGIRSNQSQTNNDLQLTVNELRNSVEQLTQANMALQSRINTQPAGVLVANGIKENPGLVGNQAVADIYRNPSLKNKMGKSLGMK